MDSGLDKMDFIIFCNSNDEKVLRLFWELNENSIEYTSAFLHNGNNISLVAICVVLYDSIMWLRHCKSLVAVLREFGWENKVVRKGLLDNIEIEIEYMRNCLNDKKALCKIWKSAYKIHNEPEKILCSVNDIVG